MELVLKRREIQDEINAALNCNGTPYDFAKWQRTIRWRYADHPLCTKGSLALGGRFNIGKNIDPSISPPFSAFYVARDKDTSLQESLGQNDPGSDPREPALANPESVLTFSVSGRLDKVLDLTTSTEKSPLADFVRLIKNFELSKALVKEAEKLPVVKPGVVKTVNQLMSSLLNPNWRHVPTLCEIPSNSQIFGQIVWQAGIEGILYPSKQTGGDCLAIFPSNFIDSLSFVTLDDQAPNSLIGPDRVDSTNCEACERTADELTGSPLRRSSRATRPS